MRLEKVINIKREIFLGCRERVKELVAIMKPGPKKNATLRNNLVKPLALYEGGQIDDRHQDCHRGHLIALEFGGPEERWNLVPLYGTFNSTGVWKTFERELASWVDLKNAPRQVTITCHYYDGPQDDQRIPTRFTIKVVDTAQIPPRTEKQWEITHTRPTPQSSDADPTEKNRYLALRQEMEESGWLIEAHLDLSGMPSYRRLPVFSERRPYAFLDYEKWKSIKDNPGSLRQWNTEVQLAQSSDFNQGQIELLRRVNRILNDGWLMSDDLHDPAYTAPRYRVPGHPPGLLVEGGHDLTPQVDHVIPQSRSGAAVFSNAMIISAKRNSSKRAQLSPQDQHALSSVQRGTGRNRRRVTRYSPY